MRLIISEFPRTADSSPTIFELARSSLLSNSETLASSLAFLSSAEVSNLSILSPRLLPNCLISWSTTRHVLPQLDFEDDEVDELELDFESDAFDFLGVLLIGTVSHSGDG